MGKAMRVRGDGHQGSSPWRTLGWPPADQGCGDEPFGCEATPWRVAGRVRAGSGTGNGPALAGARPDGCVVTG
jgi:hypothetical protein